MDENKTISKVVKSGLCVGCGTCAGICPNSAIHMLIDSKKGTYVPKIDYEKCNECGFCFDVCPGHSVDFKKLNSEIFGKEPEDILIGNYINCYTGYATDYEIRYNSASGGLVTQLLIFALEEGIIDGALVTKMSEKNPLEPEVFIARTKEEIVSASKSKYCPVPANIALKEILDPKEGEKFAVVGLPCHIHGIRRAEQINKKLKEKIVLHFGLFCACIGSFLGTEFLLYKLDIKKEDIRKLDYRGEGWPGNFSIELKNGSKESYQFPAAWSSEEEVVGNTVLAFIPLRCTLCIDGSCELSDLSFGDAWLPEFKEDKIGRSVVVSRSKIGDMFLQHAVSEKIIELNEVDSNRVRQMIPNRIKDFKARASFLRMIGNGVPVYNLELPEPELNAYLRTPLSYLRINILPKRRLWGLFRMLSQFNTFRKLLRI